MRGRYLLDTEHLMPRWLLRIALTTLATLISSACASTAGTPMRAPAHCQYVPTIEDCWAVADRIEDFCLKSCVVQKCRGDLELLCNHPVDLECVDRSKQSGGEVGGFVRRGPQTCEVPKDEVNWCQLPRSPFCQALMMVHELAHACGWHHFEGKGVPGDTGELQCQ